MSSPMVVLVRKADPGSYVYIGRAMPRFGFQASPFANPFKTGTRDEMCDAFEEWFLTQPELVQRAKAELRGRDLGCWCAPKRCHGDTLLQIANEDDTRV